MWHMGTHEASGFSGDFMDLDSVVRGVLSSQNDKEPMVQVNLFNYRSTDNTTLDCEFFYNREVIGIWYKILLSCVGFDFRSIAG